ncbi:CASTOR/POLLUX-related putative ion channel [Brachyspira sp. SAP_772]|uniref:CASTOR/POLLUX-related putative ion channel n=1 Tax=Brachyspira sp. SAP_772 TaxID=2608385 RepID=UPI0012F4ED30|nr:hypothetical protein [Brachyspira sp. SAP_772]
MIKEILKYFKYRIDRMLNKGLFYQLMLLVCVIIIILLIVSAFIILIFDYPIKDAFWDSLMQFIDTGNISSVDGSFGLVITFLMVTFIGVCGWGSLIAMINKALQDRINNLSKGNAFIMEKGHSIILGYGEEALTIIEEFLIAKIKNIVLLSEHNVDIIRKRISFIKGYRRSNIIIREGSTSRIENIKLLNIKKCSSISIINNDDTESLNILLALKKILNEERNANDEKINICLLVHNEDTLEIIKSMEDENFTVHILYKYELLYKLISQSIIYTGLSSVYEDLFSNDGNDFKIESNHNFENDEFEDVALKYMNKGVILVGIIENDMEFLKVPDSKYVIKKSDKLVGLYKNNDKNDIVTENKNYKYYSSNMVHNILLISEEKNNNDVVREIKEYIENSNLESLSYDDIKIHKNKYQFLLEKIKSSNITKIVLISEDSITDAKSINILLIIRQIIKKENIQLSILSLLNSIQKRNLIYSDDVRDFIVSGKLIGMLMAQASIDYNILYLFYGLLSKNGKDIIISSYSKYFNENKTFKDAYFDLLYRGIIIIGIKRYDDILLNPPTDFLLDSTDEIIIIITSYI